MMRRYRWNSLRRSRGVQHRARAVTLLEIVLSMGLLVTLTSMTYWFYSSSLETRARGMKEAHRLRLVRVLMDRMREEIRQASAVSSGRRVGIRGEPERIWLSTLQLPSRNAATARRSRDEPPPAEYDLVKIEYRIARHPDIRDDDGFELPIGLARVEIRVPRLNSAQTGEAFEGRRHAAAAPDQALEDARQEEEEYDRLEDGGNDASMAAEIDWDELYAPDVKYLRFCYFDGHTWWDTWDVQGDNPLPQLVLMTFGFVGHPPFEEEFGINANTDFCECMNQNPPDCDRLDEDRYTMTIRVSQADPLFLSRIGRETKAFTDALGGGGGSEE